jgi:DNA repair protein RadC
METYHQKITLKSWAEEDRPREKLLSQGRRSLTDAELIAILIGSGNRQETAVELISLTKHTSVLAASMKAKTWKLGLTPSF